MTKWYEFEKFGGSEIDSNLSAAFGIKTKIQL